MTSKQRMSWFEIFQMIVRDLAEYSQLRSEIREKTRSLAQIDETVQAGIRELVRQGLVDDAYAYAIVYDRARGCVPTPGTDTKAIFVKRVLDEIVEEDRLAEDAARDRDVVR